VCIFIYIYILLNLIKGGSPLQETFNLAGVSDGSEGGASPTRIPDTGPTTPSRRQRRKEKLAGKAGSRKGKPDDDTQTFFQLVDGKKFCKFCL